MKRYKIRCNEDRDAYYYNEGALYSFFFAVIICSIELWGKVKFDIVEVKTDKI